MFEPHIVTGLPSSFNRRLFAISHIPSDILGNGLFLGSFMVMLVFYAALLYGYVWYRTRNIWVISMAHMLNDSAPTIVYNFLN